MSDDQKRALEERLEALELQCAAYRDAVAQLRAKVPTIDGKLSKTPIRDREWAIATVTQECLAITQRWRDECRKTENLSERVTQLAGALAAANESLKRLNDERTSGGSSNE